MKSIPIPPQQLVARIGGTPEQYVEIGARQRAIVESLLPEDWSFEGKSVLDFGCGPGRTLSAFMDVAERADFVGCDIHAESIEWASAELSPPFGFFVCQEAPPFDQPDRRFDLVYGMSVFSHITSEWSRWLVELHRVMRPGGLAVVSVLGPVVAERLLGLAWDERIGMACIDFHKGWEIGGPSTLLAEWWIREHWGRAFEILRFEYPDDWFAHDFVVMRKRELAVTPEQLEAVDHRDPREHAALACNLEILQRQQSTLGEQLQQALAARAAAESEAQRLRDTEGRLTAEVDRLNVELARHQTELDRVNRVLTVIANSRSWRLTAPLRRTREMRSQETPHNHH
jgi:SAM-dependent methyltransferase